MEGKDKDNDEKPCSSSSGAAGPSAAAAATTSASEVEDATSLSELLSMPENRGATLVVPLSWCPHLEADLEGADNMARQQQQDGDEEVDKVKLDSPCLDCGNVGENWVCLHCLRVGCSRYVNNHALSHGDALAHPMCLSLADLSVWCYDCEAYLGDDDDRLFAAKNAVHIAKFGKPMPRRGKQEGGGGRGFTLEMG